MTDYLLQKIASNVDEDIDVVSSIIDEFCLQLHKGITEYHSGNGSYIGEELWHNISSQSIYHFLGFLDIFSEKYRWEKGDAAEYLMRIGNQKDWLPFFHQMEGWKTDRD